MSNIELTAHAMLRLAQRGIPENDIDLISWIGTEVEGGFLVRKQDCQAAERQLKRMIDRLRRLQGTRMVIENGRLVTAYHARPRKQRSLLREMRKDAIR